MLTKRIFLIVIVIVLIILMISFSILIFRVLDGDEKQFLLEDPIGNKMIMEVDLNQQDVINSLNNMYISG
jgi:hypothetical protein